MGSSSPKVKVPASVYRQAERGKRHIDEYYQDGYDKLSRDDVKNAQKDETRFLATKGAVDTRIAQSRAPLNFRDIGGTVGGNALAVGMAKQQGVEQGQRVQDARRVMVGKSGLGQAKTAAGMRENAARMAAENAYNKTQNDITVSNAKTAAGFELIGAGIKAYAIEDQFQQDWAKYGGGKSPTFKDKFKYITHGPEYLRNDALYLQGLDNEAALGRQMRLSGPDEMVNNGYSEDFQ